MIVDTSSNENLFLRKLNDKAEQAYYNNFPTYTHFLDLHEQGLFKSHMKEFHNVNNIMFGGNDSCERKIIMFFPRDYQEDQIYFPIAILQIINNSASDKLNHRDYLGALMNLGIERYKLGDIICDEHSAYVFCIDALSDYIIEQLIMIKRTTVTINKINMSEVTQIGPRFDVIKGTVSSLRLDSILKIGFSLSRGNATILIQGGKAFINNKLYEKNSSKVEEGDVISLRGFGKLKINTIGDYTKKGRIFIELLKYK
jgi:RNA-binding protein YlmH